MKNQLEEGCNFSKETRVSWYTVVLVGAKRFMASLHESQEEASRSCEVNRAAKALLVNHKTKEGEETRRRGAGRERESVERALLFYRRIRE